MPLFTTSSAEQTKQLGEKLAAALCGNELILFKGGLGAGKTTFTAGLAQGLKSTSAAQSPTYAIVNVYEGRLRLAHFDLYRIENADDLETAGFYDYLDEGAVIAVEWSERIENLAQLADKKPIYISIENKGGQTRAINIEGINF